MKNNPDDYILAVWEIEESFGKVNEKDVASRLNVSLPTAWEALHKLSDENMLTIGRSGLSFTPKGKIIAANTMRAHRITEYFAYSFLEVPWEESHEAVMYLEHGFTGNMLETLYKNMGFPKKCPHGNPIDVMDSLREEDLTNVRDGSYEIERIVYEDREFLRKIADSGSKPGERVKIERNDEYIIILGQNGEIKMDKYLARGIRVTK
ncbi:MAG: metal-dependent transcriptional regulator [Thermoplasmata archaeon]